MIYDNYTKIDHENKGKGKEKVQSKLNEGNKEMKLEYKYK